MQWYLLIIGVWVPLPILHEIMTHTYRDFEAQSMVMAGITGAWVLNRWVMHAYTSPHIAMYGDANISHCTLHAPNPQSLTPMV